MSTIKVNTLDTTSGTAITVDPAVTLTLSADKLSVGGVLLSQGNTAVNVLTAASTDLADATHTAMWTGKSKAIFPVDASGGAKTVQLPAANAAGRSTVSLVISIKATSSGISPNTVTVNNSSGAEVFTLYGKGDYVEFISDGTDDIRTGSEHISAAGMVHRNSNLSIAANTSSNFLTTGNITLIKDWGNLFDDASDFRMDVPYACTIRVSCFTTNQNTTGADYLTPALQRYYNSAGSTEYLFKQDNHTTSPYGFGNLFVRDFDLTVGDEIQFECYNLSDSSASNASGTANFYNSCFGAWEIVRRH